MSRKHSNISIFVPHIGCPNKCSFCNQRYITGACKGPGADDVGAAVAAAQSSKSYDPATTEIAFFGKDEIPENLAVEKCTKEQILMCFDAYNNRNTETLFD